MKVDCRWFSTNLEAYICESLGNQELQLASEHLKTCLSCRSEVQALQDLDPLVKKVFELRMARAAAAAHAPGRSIGFQLGLAGAAAALVGVLLFVAVRNPESPDGPQAASQAEPKSDSGGSDKKFNGSTPVERTKPDAPDPKSTAVKPGPEPAIPDNAPAFQVTDAAGYTTSLEDYRGRILFVGVWSADQQETAQNLQKLYLAFGNRKDLRILGVTNRGQQRPAGMTFPMVFNNGSRILETRASNFVIVDKDGKVQMRGSLDGDSNELTAKVKAKLDELGR